MTALHSQQRLPSDRVDIKLPQRSAAASTPTVTMEDHEEKLLGLLHAVLTDLRS